MQRAHAIAVQRRRTMVVSTSRLRPERPTGRGEVFIRTALSFLCARSLLTPPTDSGAI